MKQKRPGYIKEDHTGCKTEAGLEEGRNEDREIRKEAVSIMWAGDSGGIMGILSPPPFFTTVPCDHELRKLLCIEGPLTSCLPH